MINGKTGIKKIERFSTDGLPTKIGGEVADFDPQQYMEAKEIKRFSRYVQFAIAAIDQALKDAEIVVNDFNRNRIGIFLASGACGFADFEHRLITAYQKGWKTIPFSSVSLDCNNAPSYCIACRHGITGPSMTISTACTSSAQALEVASDQVSLGKIDFGVVIGVEILSEFVFKGFCRCHAMSVRNESPSEASRPFDLERDGFVAAEGAGAIVLEKLRTARERDIRPYGELAGIASTNDAFNLMLCEPSGHQIGRAMADALNSAGINKEDVSYISAHGPSIPTTDKAETNAIKSLFGDHAFKLPVSSIKGAIGGPIGATVALQTVSASMSLMEKKIPPTINYDVPDPACDLDYVPWEARDENVHSIILNSHAFGGGNSTIVLKSI